MLESIFISAISAGLITMLIYSLSISLDYMWGSSND